MHRNVDMSLMVYFHFNIGALNLFPIFFFSYNYNLYNIALYFTSILHLTNHLKSDFMNNT